MKCYSPVKRKEILTHATTQMNLEHIMLSETCQSQKYKYCMTPLIELSRVTIATWTYASPPPRYIRFIGTGSRMVVVRGGGRRDWGVGV